MLYRVAIIGDLPEYSKDYTSESVRRKVDNIVDVISYQYGSDLVINAAGFPDVGVHVAKKCLEDTVKYHLFMPCPVDDMDKLFYTDQSNEIHDVFENSWATTISSPKYTTQLILHNYNYQNIVDNSAFIICLWRGRKQGSIYSAILHALGSNKLIIDGTDDLKLMTKLKIYGE